MNFIKKSLILYGVFIFIPFIVCAKKNNSTNLKENNMKKIYLESNYQGEKNFMKVNHNKIYVTKEGAVKGIKIRDEFYPLKKEQHCYKVISEISSSKTSSKYNVSETWLYKIDDKTNSACDGSNNKVRDNHYIEIPKDTYRNLPCCGQLENDSEEFFQLYNDL